MDNNQLKLDCQACKTPRSMTMDKVPRFSGVVRAIGVILLIPSILAMATGAGCAIVTTVATVSPPTSQVHTAADVAPEAAARGLAGMLGCGTGILIAMVGFVGGLLGWILLMSKSVWRCTVCNFILDRA